MRIQAQATARRLWKTYPATSVPSACLQKSKGACWVTRLTRRPTAAEVTTVAWYVALTMTIAAGGVTLGLLPCGTMGSVVLLPILGRGSIVDGILRQRESTSDTRLAMHALSVGCERMTASRKTSTSKQTPIGIGNAFQLNTA